MTNTSLPPRELKIEEYICYLYLAIADADMNIVAKEIAAVEAGLKKLKERYYPQSAEALDTLIPTMKHYIQTQSEQEKRDIIERLSKRFPLDFDIKIDIIGDMHELIHADEFVAMSEYNMLNYIRVCLIGS